jgi:hypothetical protein
MSDPDKKFEIPTKGGRPLTEKDFENDLPAAPNDHAYSDDFKKFEDELVEKHKPKPASPEANGS